MKRSKNDGMRNPSRSWVGRVGGLVALLVSLFALIAHVRSCMRPGVEDRYARVEARCLSEFWAGKVTSGLTQGGEPLLLWRDLGCGPELAAILGNLDKGNPLVGATFLVLRNASGQAGAMSTGRDRNAVTLRGVASGAVVVACAKLQYLAGAARTDEDLISGGTVTLEQADGAVSTIVIRPIPAASEMAVVGGTSDCVRLGAPPT